VRAAHFLCWTQTGDSLSLIVNSTANGMQIKIKSATTSLVDESHGLFYHMPHLVIIF